ncbi:MAG TPA: pyridoxal-phosphate dependent enzyme, partial [Gemmatimonadaceae bacterium]|nr:pyridoxal-phosphate dependent enzyme [Gemmatimonadaceae bacterium]
WLDAAERLPRMIVAQAAGCAPLVRALQDGADRATPWENPWTYAAGLRVPGPLGDRLVLKTIRESGGDAEAATEDEIRDFSGRLCNATGIDAAPEGGAALFVTAKLVQLGRLSPESEVVVYNTGSGASYRQ